MKDALDEGATTVDLKHLKRRSWSVAQCQRMFKEIQEGERQLMETESDVENLRSSLGLLDSNTSASISNGETPQTKSSRGRKVGQRKPKRDSVGLEKDVS